LQEIFLSQSFALLGLAAELTRVVAEQGYTEAQYLLASLYAEGEIAERDDGRTQPLIAAS